MTPPGLEFAFELRVTVAPMVELGQIPAGVRRVIPITGGAVAGPLIRGRVLPVGEDWQTVEPGGLTILDAHYVIETDDGAKIEIRNQGIRHADAAVLEQLAAGGKVDPGEYYFRAIPRFTVAAKAYQWLRRSIFIATAERLPELVIVSVWRVL
ncbi:MAG TPA: DUF3237 domain-containing protein [Terracidiphilus sp.]|nr:DUF3237 domain-containing protein [Terracidiphilus sp.]